MAIGAHIVARDGLDQVVQGLFVARLLALRHGRRHDRGEGCEDVGSSCIERVVFGR